MKRILAVMLVMMLLLALFTGCSKSSSSGSGESSSSESSGKTRGTTGNKETNALTVGATEAPNSLDPEYFALQAEDNIIVQVYEPLIMVLDDGSYEPVLAESYTPNEDGSAVDIVLRSDVKFHSGDTLTSEDVAYTMERLENSTITSTLVGLMEIEVQDDTHFTLNFPAASMGAGFDDLMPYLQAMCIVNKSWAEERIENPTDKLGLEEDGTGPYMFDSIADNNDVVLKRFSDYWGKASIDTINIKYITGDLEMAFEAGDIDMATYKKSTFDLISTYDNVATQTSMVNNVAFLIFGCADGLVTSDRNIREAIAYSLDRPTIASFASDDGGQVAYNLATPLVQYYTDNADHLEQDLEKSKQMMTDAGYSDSNRCELTLITAAAYPAWVSACEVIKEQMEQSYFTVNIEQLPDTNRYFMADYEMGIISIGLTNTFASYSVMFDSSSGMNLAAYEDEEVLNAFASITDEASAQAAMKIATESLAYYPIYYPGYYSAFDADLNAGSLYVTFSAFLYKDFSWK